MLTVMICGVILIMLYVILHIAEKNKRQRKRESQLYGLSLLRNGLELLTQVQQHRGISAALLNGDRSFAARQTVKKNEVERVFMQLEPLLMATPALRSDVDSLRALQNDWERMSHGIANLLPEQSFAQHTALIRKVIHLLGDMGEHLGLLDGEGTPFALLANTLLLKLPLLMESIGQARALGSGYAAKGQCGAVGRIRMSFLAQHIRECQQDIRAAMTEQTQAMQRVNALLGVLSERFIEVNTVDIAPDVFFRTATEAIEACLAMWQNVANKTGEIVEVRG
jgi:hypothetical protein